MQALLGQGEPLSDPFLLTDMDKAVVRIQEAIENEELMVIYGDYDVDGISATAILYECLTSQGAHVRCKLPTRGSGYGLTRAALESLASKGFKLVVTVDNGISAVEEAACAKELGLDLIITDHHLPGDTLPDAIAVVDPKRPDDESPFKDLCGAGVAFKLCAALEVSIFNGRSGPMVSAHLKAIRPAELGNTPSEQAAWFEAFRTGGSLDAARAAALLPARADTVSLYRRIRGGHVAAADLQPVFAAEGPQNTGKTLASLTALQELGLIEEQEGRWLPVPVTAKQDLASAPVLQKLAELAKQA